MRCRWCNAELPRQLKSYPHPNGWRVKGLSERVWLYVECKKCGYQWALWKLGVPMDVEVDLDSFNASG